MPRSSKPRRRKLSGRPPCLPNTARHQRRAIAGRADGDEIVIGERIDNDETFFLLRQRIRNCRGAAADGRVKFT